MYTQTNVKLAHLAGMHGGKVMLFAGGPEWMDHRRNEESVLLGKNKFIGGDVE